MNCVTCNTEIPSAFVHCISSNTCAACGGPIMSDEHQTLLTELKEAMSKMEHNPEGLAGWLLSNYRLTKIGSGEPTEFYGKKRANQQAHNNVKIYQDNTSDFIKRAGVDPSLLDASKSRKNKFQLLASAINEGNLDDLYGDNESEDNGYEEDMQDIPMPSMQRREPGFIDTEAMMLAGNGQPLSSSETALLMQQISMSNTAENSTAIVKNERLKRLQKQENIVNGVNMGVNKNGFRRAD